MEGTLCGGWGESAGQDWRLGVGRLPLTLDVSGLDTGGADVTPGLPDSLLPLAPPSWTFLHLVEPSYLFALQEYRIRVLLTLRGGL